MEHFSGHPGYTRHTNPTGQDRCADNRDGRRCQLMTHDDGQHLAMINAGPPGQYRQWGQPWTKPQPGQAPLPWATGFPRVER